MFFAEYGTALFRLLPRGIRRCELYRYGRGHQRHHYAQFADTSRMETNDVYSGRKITFTSGANNGLSMEVKQYQNPGSGGIFTLTLAMPYNVSVEDTYTLIQGCDKTLNTCYNRFNNVVNFRGEPLVPGLDRSLETAGTRSTW